MMQTTVSSATSWPTETKAGALLWPAIDLLDTSLKTYLEPHYQEQLQSQGYFLEGEDRVGRAFVEEFQRLGSLEPNLSEIHVPILLIHGDADTEVPHRQSEHAFEALEEPKRIVVVPGGDHCLRQPAEQRLVIDEVVTWFTRYLEEPA